MSDQYAMRDLTRCPIKNTVAETVYIREMAEGGLRSEGVKYCDKERCGLWDDGLQQCAIKTFLLRGASANETLSKAARRPAPTAGGEPGRPPCVCGAESDADCVCAELDRQAEEQHRAMMVDAYGENYDA